MAENYFGITDTGRVRSNNEDTFIAEPVLNGRFIAACVIDGVGGYAGGEVAARLARETILDRLRTSSDDIVKMMREAVAAANERIYRERRASKENEQMACVLTLALVDLANNKFYYAHVGDTRLYLFRDRTLVKVSRDHSFVGFLEDSGRLSEEAAMQHPKRNEINKALGFEAHIDTAGDYIETGDSPFLPGDVILLCSDGLSDMIGNNAITSVLDTNDDLSAKGKALVKEANEAGGKDNITVVLVHNDKAPVQHTATMPAAVVKEDDNTKSEEVIAAGKDDHINIAGTVEKRRTGSSVPVLAILCILLLAMVIWLLYNTYVKKGNGDSYARQSAVKKERSEQEQRFIDSISRAVSKEVFVLNTAGGQPIVITDSIFVRRDSLHIIGNGVTLLGDTAYSGPALILTDDCKYILLDSMTIENFDVGVAVQNKALHLKNVQFKNCRIPVQYQYLLQNNTVVTGSLADSIMYTSDSASK